MALAILCSGLVAPELHGQEEASITFDRARLQARQLLQGVPSSPFLDSLKIEHLAHAIVHIYSAVPEVRGISNYGDDSYLVLSLSDVGKSQLDTLPFDDEPDPYLRTRAVEQAGVAAIDSLNQVLGVDSIEARYFGRRINAFRPYFSQVPNVPVVARYYQELPEIGYAGPERYVGDGDWITHFRKDGAWYFVFSKGGGDCLSGCIRRDYYYVMYAPDEERAELVDSLMDGKFKTDRVHLWNIPSRLSVMPYRDYEDLRSKTEDRRWWVRHHAVSVVSYFLQDSEGPWRGDSTQDPEHFKMLKQLVDEHRVEVLFLLSDRVADEDEWVRRAARHALTFVAGTDYGDGEDGRDRWRTWVKAETGANER